MGDYSVMHHEHDEEKRRREDEAFWEAIKTCDEDTYRAIISILREEGLLRE